MGKAATSRKPRTSWDVDAGSLGLAIIPLLERRYLESCLFTYFSTQTCGPLQG